MTEVAQQLFTEGRRTVSVVLDYPPTVNNLYLTIISKGRPIRVPSTESKKFKAGVERHCRANEIKPLKGPLLVEIKAFRPRRVGDLDNVLKVTFDALKGFAFEDDKQIERIEAERFEDPKFPRIELVISER